MDDASRRSWSWGVEAAEESFNRLVESQAREAEQANAVHAAWAESARRYDLRLAAANRDAWIRWHREQAARHRATLASLVSNHEQAARALEAVATEGGGG